MDELFDPSKYNSQAINIRKIMGIIATIINLPGNGNFLKMGSLDFVILLKGSQL
ncbi:MAG: hypothetical protein ABIN97_02180 [Ginsengibacter sp.]